MHFLWGVAASLSSLLTVSARHHDGRFHGNVMPMAAVPPVPLPEIPIPVTSRNGTELPPYNTTYYFDQLIDHKRPSLGTFKQRYWHTWEWYQPGGPIVLMTPGEANAEPYNGYLTNRTIAGMIAQQQNGSNIVLEHRYYGLSNPYEDLSVESLRFHTIQQAIEDLEYFAKNVRLPQPDGDKVTPDKAPWVFVGGSYSGALVSWAMVEKPNLFAAGYSSSGVVQALTQFWKYFEPIREYMPKNCASDVAAVIKHVDEVFLGSNETEKVILKNRLGFWNLTHYDDAAGALRNNLWDWQSIGVTSGTNTRFHRFCNALEIKDGVEAGPEGYGLQHAINAWGAFNNNGYLAEVCEEKDMETCLGTYDPTDEFWTDETVDNTSRSWFWIVCNEVGWLQQGAPQNQPTLVTRMVDLKYDLRQCQLMFPKAFKKPPTPRVALTNLRWHGWHVRKKNLFFANGDRDPWRDVTISAKGLNVKSTPQMPIHLSQGFHCSDLSRGARVDPTVAAVQDAALSDIARWLKAWKPKPVLGPITLPWPIPRPFVPSRPTHVKKPLNAWFKTSGRA